MPIYEYRCTRGHTFETLQRMSDDALTTCQACKAPAERVLHAPAVHFKGSGFYNTDYGTRKRAREKSAEGKGGEGKSGEDKSGESGSATSTESKTESPAAAKKAGSPAKSSA